jgi:hypothetical protein|tara:strand:+ start:169 stop:531 length:363 start_codon:yes stop_codon:yes gene_type:complete
MKEEIRSYTLSGLADAIQDSLNSDCTPEEIVDCFISTVKNNIQYHRVCAKHSKEVLDLFYKIDRSNKVVNLNVDSIHDKKNWVDYTELPDQLSDEELLKQGYKMKVEDGSIVWTKNKTQN